MRLHGIIRAVPVDGGCWRLDTDDGKHYEIDRGSAPAGLLVEGKAVTLIGKLRPDLMSTCMVGPIVDVVTVEG